MGLLIYYIDEMEYTYVHSLYFPVIISAIIYKIKGGLIAGLTAGFLVGPFIPHIELELFRKEISWVIRSGLFVITGIFTGIVFEILHYQFEELENAALFDPGTKLPNKYNLLEDLEWKINNDNIKNFSLILINIANYFEIINNLGHNHSGEFLQKITREIKNRLEMDIKIYNIYDDNLSILINKKVSPFFINQLTEILEEPFIYNQIPIYLDSYLGIACFPENGEYNTQILQNAYLSVTKARNQAKKYRFYDDSFHNLAQKNFALLGKIRKAFKDNEFLLYYQPKLNLKNKKITGAEALIRWHHKHKKFISPGKFIPQVEKTALINDLTSWVIKKGTNDLSKFKKNEVNIKLSFNITPRNLQNDNFINQLTEITDKYQINPQDIELELTETDIMQKLENAREKLSFLTEIGFRIALDDFGTGYSSLSYLKNLNFNIIKIDRTFVKNINNDNRDKEIVNTAIKLGHILNKKVIAEGVDSEKIKKELINMDCDLIQGYYLSKPLPFAKFKSFYNKF